MNALLQTLRNLGPIRLAVMGGVAVVLIGFFLFLMTRMSNPEMALLYSDLDLTDSGQIVAKLDEARVRYEIRANGASIMVPADQVDRMRVLMAQSGLPKGGSLGYEIFDRSDSFGTTNFVQNINRLRAMEGELARTIGTIAHVRQARVHLVLPERELFSREPQSPTASVFLRLTGTLGSEQIRAIQHLIAAAVPRLQPKDISVVDDRGNLLARGPDGDENELRIAGTEELRLAQERRLRETIETLLSRTIGYGKVRAQVSVEMNFDRVTTTAETFDPNSQVARSTQSVQQQDEANEAGVDAVTVANNLPEQSQQAAPTSSAGPTSRSRRNEETINYEISRTVQNSVREIGLVRRLSVAVLVDGSYERGPHGETVYAPRSSQEMAQLAALVRSAVGFDANRGDTVEVVNMRFASDESLAPAEAATTAFGLTHEDLFKIAEILVLGVVAVLVILLVIRPLLARMLEGGRAAPPPADEFGGLLTDQSGLQAALAGAGLPPGMTPPELGPPRVPKVENEELEALIDLNQVEGRVRASSLKKVGEIVEKHPEEAVSIIRSWMYQET